MKNYTIEKILRDVNRGIVPEFEAKLRSHLEQHDKEWLIEQIIRMTLDKHSLQERDRKVYQEMKERQRRRRAERLRKMRLDENKLDAIIPKYEAYTRAILERDGYLDGAPQKGSELITEAHRTAKGEALLTEAKDVLFALLYGDEDTAVSFDRVERELLTITVPRFKAWTLYFMKASTELGGFGTWQDPENVSNDEREEDVLMLVEYGETASERIGDGILSTLRLINNLEVNEQVLYVRMVDVEQSSLIT